MTDISLPETARVPPAVLRLRPLLAEARALIRLALPIMGIALVNMAMSVTDTLMVSSAFGAGALAAVAVGSDFYSTLFYLGAGTIGGLAPLYTAAIVNRDPAAQARLERTGQVLAALIALVLVPVAWTSPDWLAHLGLDPVLLDQGRGYARAMALTLIPMLGVVLYRTLLTAAERPAVFLKVTMAMVPLNALGNHILMHGMGPIPAFGPTGAGLSSLVVALASLGILVLIARRTAGRSASRAHAGSTSLRDLGLVLRVGIPIGIATVAELGIFLGATLYAATHGAAEVAAHTLALRVGGITYAITVALMQAAMVRSARAEAAGIGEECKAVKLATLVLSLFAGCSVCLCVLVIAQPLSAWMFDADPIGASAAALAIWILAILALTEAISNPGSVAAGVLRGRKDTRMPMVYTLAGYWAVGAPVGLWLAQVCDLGIIGVWLGLALGTLFMSLCMVWRIWRLR